MYDKMDILSFPSVIPYTSFRNIPCKQAIMQIGGMAYFAE